MKVIKNEIRPIGFVTIEFNENEVQTLIGVIDQICMYRQMPMGSMKGTVGDLYEKLNDLIT